MLTQRTKYHMFAGDKSIPANGMDAYEGAYDDIEHAQKVAASGKFDWAQIVEAKPLELVIRNVGRWDDAQNCMLWMANVNDLEDYQYTIKTCQMVIKAGIHIVTELPHTPQRETLIKRAHVLERELFDAILTTGKGDSRAVIHVARQVVTQLIDTCNRTPISKKDTERRAWLRAAGELLRSIKDIQFSEGEV